MTRSASSIGDPPDVSRARARAVVAGGIGNFVEWYDFALYGYFATTIATLFFPGSDPSAALLKTFAIFGVGFFVRRLGGSLRPHRRPCRSPKRTFHVGAADEPVDGSHRIAAHSPCRRCGRAGAAAVLPFSARVLRRRECRLERLRHRVRPAGRRGRYASALPVSVVLGTAAGALVALLVTSQASAASLDSWAWRIPFFTALALGLAGLYLRLRIEDSPVFRAVQMPAWSSKCRWPVPSEQREPR